eukprot:CAMPEP_0115102086 /NCGR_PEP_ID=MMETSP0227-20121206/33662_1 /TAXON_ID=89957 /ORGANISM="Polarella glacialis, Strain CCMP 1383" /LENGTH=62 /DNA_ID=CAMNT_0002498049 /DNA_START=153 /DNA_END=341 /DNA_ORIENTATION=+
MKGSLAPPPPPPPPPPSAAARSATASRLAPAMSITSSDRLDEVCAADQPEGAFPLSSALAPW